jgi:hypothetical protein
MYDPSQEIRQRKVIIGAESIDSDDDHPFQDVPDLSKELPQASDRIGTEVVDSALASLPSRFVYSLIQHLKKMQMVKIFPTNYRGRIL